MDFSNDNHKIKTWNSYKGFYLDYYEQIQLTEPIMDIYFIEDNDEGEDVKSWKENDLVVLK